MDMMVSWFALLVLGGIGLLVLGGLVVLAVLLAHEKTRTVGIVLLILLAVPVVLGAAAGLYFIVHLEVPVQERPPEILPPAAAPAAEDQSGVPGRHVPGEVDWATPVVRQSGAGLGDQRFRSLKT